MGLMKFMFPNDLEIYLHDTPDKSLFSEKERQFSSGCVRLEDAPRLAKWLFGKKPKLESDVAEQQVPLPEPVPVYLSYLTVAPTDRGIALLEDAYGRDGDRSEEHTSELQSLMRISYAVFCLKKKKHHGSTYATHT